MRAVCRQHGGALALTSANLSGEPSPLEASNFEALWPACAVVFDGGIIEADRAGSTVVDLSAPGTYRIVRAGIAQEATEALLQKAGLVRL